MSKVLILLVLFSSILFSENSDVFNDRQELLLNIKQVIQDEESIAKAYEEYLINELKPVTNISQFITNDYLGTAFERTFSSPTSNHFNNYIIGVNTRTINYRLRTHSDIDTQMIHLYESNKYRKKTFVNGNTVYIKLDSNLAKANEYLINKINSSILECTDVSSKRYCTKNNHMYIYETDSKANLMMYYFIENFETGPIIINDDVSYHEKDEFKVLTPGTKLIDFNNKKFLKTYDDIRKVN